MKAPVKAITALLTVLAICCACFQSSLIREKSSECSQLEAAKSDRLKQLARIKDCAGELADMQLMVESRKRELRILLLEDLTPEREAELIPSHIAAVEREAARLRGITGARHLLVSRVSEGTMIPGAQRESKEAFLAEYPACSFQVQLTGTWESLLEFLKHFGKQERLVTIERLSLSPARWKKAGFGPLVRATIPVTAYLRQ
ncbi:MAG: hypothetical protein RDV48_23495 [Candidatus Eremiobacteraeota bacterium]|nr:hypothetical protein [Candidatus Eremiobacteraeota bacterium]